MGAIIHLLSAPHPQGLDMRAYTVHPWNENRGGWVMIGRVYETRHGWRHDDGNGNGPATYYLTRALATEALLQAMA